MAKVLIGWELGGGLGHMVRAAALAHEFTAAGDRVFVVLQSLHHSGLIAWPESTRLLQAPTPGATRPLMDACSYAEILFSCGYHDARTLASMVIGWSSLVELIEPDVVIADHAPTASLVARLAGIPLVRMGPGFFSPPGKHPFPVFRTWAAIDNDRLQAVQAQVLGAINGVAQSCSVAFEHIAQALQPELDLVSSWPELDHYAGMRADDSVEFIGPERNASAGPALQWPSMGGRRVLAYLKADYSGFAEVVRALRREDAATVAFVLGDSALPLDGWDSDRFSLRRQMFDPWPAMQACDAVVCHAGIGTVATALEAGKPVLMLPYTTEQFIYAERVQQTGAGLRVDEGQVASGVFPDSLQRFLSSAEYGRRARGLARTHGSRGDAIPSAVRKIKALLQRRKEGA